MMLHSYVFLSLFCAAFSGEFFQCRSFDERQLKCELINKTLAGKSSWAIQEQQYGLYGSIRNCSKQNCTFSNTSVTFNTKLYWDFWDGFKLFLPPYEQEFNISDISFPFPPAVDIFIKNTTSIIFNITNYTRNFYYQYRIYPKGEFENCSRSCTISNLSCGRGYSVCIVSRYIKDGNKSICTISTFVTNDCPMSSPVTNKHMWILVAFFILMFVILFTICAFKRSPTCNFISHENHPATGQQNMAELSSNRSNSYNYIYENGYESLPNIIPLAIHARRSPSAPQLPPPQILSGDCENYSSNLQLAKFNEPFLQKPLSCSPSISSFSKSIDYDATRVSDSGVYSPSPFPSEHLQILGTDAEIYKHQRIQEADVKL